MESAKKVTGCPPSDFIAQTYINCQQDPAGAPEYAGIAIQSTHTLPLHSAAIRAQAHQHSFSTTNSCVVRQ
jgi:hypothetical protein